MKATTRWASLLTVTMLIAGMMPVSAFATGVVPVQTAVNASPSAASAAAAAPDELIVKIKEGGDLSALAAKYGARIASRNEKLSTVLLKFPQGADLASLQKKLKDEPFVGYAERNVALQAATLPNDPKFTSQKSYIQATQVDKAWDVTTGSPNVTIAIIDTGVDTSHPDLKPNLVPGWNTISNSTNVSDDNGHGTHTAGVAAAAYNNAVGIAGVAGTSKIMPVKALGSQGSGWANDVAEGVIWAADHGARVISMSFGTSQNLAELQDAITYAYRKGAVVLAPTGNSGSDGCSSVRPRYPAAMNHVVAVASMNTATKSRSAFANCGPYVDISAPGENVITTERYSSYSTPAAQSTSWTPNNGTSLSTAYAAGVAALVLSQRPQLSPDQVEQALEDSATTTNTAPNVYWNQETGFGLINAFKALTQPVDSGKAGLDLIGPSTILASLVNGGVSFSFQLDQDAPVTLKVYQKSADKNVLVKTLLNQKPMTAGLHEIPWDLFGEDGSKVADGSYHIEMQAYDAAGQATPIQRDWFAVDNVNGPPEIRDASPNPFMPLNGRMELVFYAPEDEYMTIRVRSVATGQVVRTLAENELEFYYKMGNGIFWDGRDDNSQPCPVGEYVFEVETIADMAGNPGGVATSDPILVKNPEFMNVEIYGPNPFNPYNPVDTQVMYGLDGNVTEVRVELVNSEGVPVRTFRSTGYEGTNVQQLDGVDDNGNRLADGTYTIHLAALDPVGNILSEATGGPVTVDSLAGVQIPNFEAVVVDEPNPFNPNQDSALIRYMIDADWRDVRIEIINSESVPVRTIHSYGSSGYWNAELWDGLDDSGNVVPDGTYTLHLAAATDWGVIVSETSGPTIGVDSTLQP
jgi:subtilisin family serine protease